MISANGVEYKNVPEQVQYLTEQVADIWTAIEGINPPDLTLYALKTYVDAADSALGIRITNVENSIGTLLTKTEAANTYAKIADIGTYINLSDYVKTTDMYTYVQAEIQNFDLDSNTDFTALKSRVSTLESSVSSMTSDIADANTTAANAQTAAGNAVNTANNAYNTATSAASDVAEMQTTINNYDSRIDAVESTVDGFEDDLETTQNTANAALAKADSALSMIAGLHSLTKEEVEFEGDSVAITGFVEGSLCNLTKLEGKTKKSENLLVYSDVAETTFSGTLKYKIVYGAIILNGQASESQTISIPLTTLIPAGDYYAMPFAINYNAVNGVSLAPWADVTYFGVSNVGRAVTISTERKTLSIYVDASITYANAIIMPMLVKGSTAPTTWSQGYSGLKSVSISGLSTGGGVVITTSEGTTSLIPTLDDDTMELRAYDYIEQTISGTILTTSLVRASGIVDLGTLNWADLGGGYEHYFNAQIENLKPNTTNILSPDLSVNNVAYDLMQNLQIRVEENGQSITIRNDAYNSASDFKQGMSGVLLVYERAIPVTTVLATVTYTDVSAYFEAGATINVNNANTEYGVESTSTMYGYVAE